MGDRYLVIDDFLSQQEHLAVWQSFKETSFATINGRAWNHVYRLTDGAGLTAADYRIPSPALRDGDELPAPPALHPFIGELTQAVGNPALRFRLGRWIAFSLAAYIYPPGSGLGWHTDGSKVAAFIYYAHPLWRSSWGGELLIADSDAPLEPTRVGVETDGDLHPYSRFYDESGRYEEVCLSAGTYIYPRPNRLVLIAGGTLHCIKKVDAAAGEAFRASLSGFFFGDEP